MEKNADINSPLLIDIRNPASSLNTLQDPQDIKDTETPDVLNMVFDRGLPEPRLGSFLAFEAPTGETNAFLNSFVFTTSNRLQYLVCAYAPNFYVRDTVNNQWVPINGTYTPPEANNSLIYGNVVWNNGVGDDRGYFGNGTDPTIKWHIALNYVVGDYSASATQITLESAVQFRKTGRSLVIQGTSGFFNVDYVSITGNVITLSKALGQSVGNGAAVAMTIENMSGNFTAAHTYTNAITASGDTTLTLLDSSTFPASGTVSVYSGNSIISLAYSANSGNVLTLTGTVGAIVLRGAVVIYNNTGTITVPVGKLFTKFQGRLFVGNSYGMESTFYYSNVGNPENFAIAGTPSGGGFYGFIQGTGELTGLFDFGQYLGALKGDSMHRFEFSIDATNATKVDQVTPLISDDSMGCPFPNAFVKKNNTLYYPSQNSGILSVAPQVTGFQTTINLQILSQKIQNTYNLLDFTNSRSTDFETKIFFTCATADAIDTILVYDTMLDYWTRFNNWPVKDWFKLGDKLYFGSYQDNNIYECFHPSMTDNNNPYSSYVYTKRFDFGKQSLPKTQTLLYVQGKINAATKLYCDLLFNDMGTQQIITYLIDGTKPYVVQPITTALAMSMMGIPIFGDIPLAALDNTGVFKVALPVPIRYGFFNIQCKFYTLTAGANWSIDGLGANPRVEVKFPQELVINTDGTISGSVGGTINSGGGSSASTTGSTSTSEVVIAVQSGSDVTIDLSQLAHTVTTILYLARDGQIRTPGTSWTQLGSVITVTDSTASSDYVISYTY